MEECEHAVFFGMICTSLSVFSVCALYGLCSSKQGVPSWHSDSSSWSNRGALLSNNRGFVALLLLACSRLPSPSLSLIFFPLSFFSEPIFLSEVLIWGAGQWREGREGGQREERTGVRERRRRVVIAADGRPFVPSFPGSSLEPLRLQLRWSLPARVAERGKKKRAQWSVQLESSNKNVHADAKGKKRRTGGGQKEVQTEIKVED